MKKIMGSVVTLAALVLGGYYGTGLVTERTLKKNLAMLDQSSGVSVEVASYNRGLFASKVMLTWQMQTPERIIKNQTGGSVVIPVKTYTFDMPITVYHGPVMYASHRVHFGLGYANSQVVLPKAYMSQFKEHFTTESTLPTLDLTLLVNYANKTYLHVDVPAFRLISKDDQSQFEWLGMNSDHVFSSTMDETNGHMTVNGLRMTKNAYVAVLEQVGSTYDLHRAASGLYLGDVNVNVPSFVVSQDGKAHFEVKTFQASSSSDADAGLFGSAFHASFGKMLMNDKTYGPGQVSFSIKNLDAVTLADINNRVGQMQQGNDAERQQALLTLLPELPKLFSKGATIDLSELHVVGPDGAVDGSLHLMLPKEETGNPFQMIQKIEGQGKVQLPAVLLKTLLTHSAKKKLSLQSATAVATQDKSMETKPVASDAPSALVTTTPLSTTAPQGDASNQAPATALPMPPVSALDQQAADQADKQIANLIHSGALVAKGSDYVIDIKLAAGQFSVNGKPLNAGMLQF